MKSSGFSRSGSMSLKNSSVSASGFSTFKAAKVCSGCASNFGGILAGIRKGGRFGGKGVSVTVD
jgi:hypothetical protein